jgi:hypothetical protein
MHRYTIKELEEWTDYRMLKMLIQDRSQSTKNMYSPLNQRLNRLHAKLENNEELTR